MNLNMTMIAGRLTRDNELKYSAKGTAVCGNSIAVNRKWKNAQEQQQEETTFFDVVAFGGTAELMANYTIKGSPVFVEARMKNERWEDSDGVKRSRNVFVIERLQFLERAGDQADRAAKGHQGGHGQDRLTNTGPPQGGGRSGTPQGGYGGGGDDYHEEDDIPF